MSSCSASSYPLASCLKAAKEKKMGNTQLSGPYLIRPALYHFKFPDHLKDLEGWGWHRAAEAVDAINATREFHGRLPLTSAQIENEYAHHAIPMPNTYREGQGRAYYYVSSGGPSYELTRTETWLQTALENGFFIPAGVTMSILAGIEKNNQKRKRWFRAG